MNPNLPFRRTGYARLGARTVRSVVVVCALVVFTAAVLGRSEAAFTATTENTGNTFSTGSLVLADDDSTTAMFSVTNMVPGTPAVKCLAVTYSGSIVPTPVKVHGSVSGSLPTYLDMTIEVGTGGSFASCTGFTPSSTIFTGEVGDFATTHAAWASALTVFTAAANPTTRVLRFTISVQDVNAAQNLTATAAYTFETRS